MDRNKFIQYLTKSLEVDATKADELFDQIETELKDFRGANKLEFLERSLSSRLNQFQIKKPTKTSRIQLTENARRVLNKRYLRKNHKGEIMEMPEQLFRRVAKAVAKADAPKDVTETEERFYNMLCNLEFLPNSPTLMNAGKKEGQLAACFVLPIEDSVESIFDTLKHTALIQKSGGGTGFNFSKLRPKKSTVHSTHGTASGPVSFIHMFNAVTETIKQGGARRGANMAILNIDHPDILEFVHAKDSAGVLTNFNLSVGITNAFMEAVKNDHTYTLTNGEHLRAKKVFAEIAQSAWKTGDPGLIFIDKVNATNPTPHIGKIESTNPCGEQPLLPYEACNLGSINLNAVIKEGKIDWDTFERIIKEAVHFLDNVIDVNSYPIAEIEQITKGNRKIGLGIMGLADLFIKLNIPYNSQKALTLAKKIMSFVQKKGRAASESLAKTRGSYPHFRGKKPIRNATVTTIAPTGTISLTAGCSSGIEPIYAKTCEKHVLEGERLVESYPASTVTAHEISPTWHVNMQAVFQKYSDSAVSKTVNLSNSATVEDVAQIYRFAYESGCKGITIYRDGSKPTQVLNSSVCCHS